MNYLINDLKAASRGIDLILKESIKYQKDAFYKIYDNCSLKTAFEEKICNCQVSLSKITTQDISNTVKETCERASMVVHGLKVYATAYPSTNEPKLEFKGHSVESSNDPENFKVLPKGISPEDLEVTELHVKDKELIEKLEKEYELKLQKEATSKEQEEYQKHGGESLCSSSTLKAHNDEVVKKLQTPASSNNNLKQPSVKKFVPKKQQLSPEAKQRKVPSSRIGRMISFGSLAAGLGVGAIAQVTRKTLGISAEKNNQEEKLTLDQIFLTEANAERIVNTLCKVRGAALKIGQIFSIQDNTIISPVLQKAFERVRQSADFMPTWQVHKVLNNELGPNWRDKLNHFEEKPFAAASIGQVHYVQLKDGRECAMKIQYPGVAQGIESDINNLVGVLKLWNIFPEGLFIDNLVEVAKKELAWEVDYSREARCTKKFKELLSPYTDYIVPEVIDELSTNQIFTSTLVEGVPVDQCVNLDEESRARIAKLIMELCLREIFQFRCMQTDPNWSNFFYDQSSEKLSLLDFGATRSYEMEFVKKYIEVIKAAADGDRDKVLQISQEMGFLTGYESKNMKNAHVDAVVILAEVFSSEEAFDFGRQDTTLRIQKLVPTIVAERLCPPPEEIYSLHRKLSGVFLLCAKLKVKISCRQMFLRVFEEFKKEAK